ncbi:NAD-dependent epimerase/dehydratase family protein [Microbacterium sp. NPDC076911]|uniref:NAD-dependent epimerase/dehydratase family protein n=1 Tax=Microbacterium sp. NPDC076911 TaxID=3154958 RepID=UPI003437AAF1
MQKAIEGGAEVVCLGRGESGQVPDGARLVQADRLSPNAYDGVQGDWDEVVELAYAPELVEPALEALAASTSHWTLVSSVSVYGRNDEPHADESATLMAPRDRSAYADAKVMAERNSSRHLGSRLLIARPGLIVGPCDPSDRFGYWPARLSRGGQCLPQLSPIASFKSSTSEILRSGSREHDANGSLVSSTLSVRCALWMTSSTVPQQ